MTLTVGIVGMGAVGSAVAKHLTEHGIEGLELIAICDKNPPNTEFALKNLSIPELVKCCDIIVEALPADQVPTLAQEVFKYNGKTLVLISSCALELYPDALTIPKDIHSVIIVPPGALFGIKELPELAKAGITSGIIRSTKKPDSFEGTPLVDKKGIKLDEITELKTIFEGHIQEATKLLPANVNVAKTYSMVCQGEIDIEVCADPGAEGNTHELMGMANGQPFHLKTSSKTDPRNQKSSKSTPLSIIEALKGIILKNGHGALITLQNTPNI